MSPVTAIGIPLIQLKSVDSSNNYAMAQVQAQLAEHGTTWLAEYQTAGRGQRGKSWEASPGQNIIMTTAIVPTGILIHHQFQLSMAVALACNDFLAHYALHYTSIKWPNDIYWKDRKAGGILIENVLQGNEWKYALVGIGLNINQTTFDPALKNPVSLKQVTGKHYELPALAKELCICLENRWQQLQRDSHLIFTQYNQHLYKLNEIVRLKKDNVIIEAKLLGVNEQGALMIDTGIPTAIPFGEVEWLLDH